LTVMMAYGASDTSVSARTDRLEAELVSQGGYLRQKIQDCWMDTRTPVGLPPATLAYYPPASGWIDAGTLTPTPDLPSSGDEINI
jgi:hypothetical protein